MSFNASFKLMILGIQYLLLFLIYVFVFYMFQYVNVDKILMKMHYDNA